MNQSGASGYRTRWLKTVRLSRTGKRIVCRLYNIWDAMRKRCYHPASPNYRFYGAKGTTICDAWRDDYAAFRAWSIANGYGKDLTIDRINPRGHYEPGNCRWVGREVQQLNMSRRGPFPQFQRPSRLAKIKSARIGLRGRRPEVPNEWVS